MIDFDTCEHEDFDIIGRDSDGFRVWDAYAECLECGATADVQEECDPDGCGLYPVWDSWEPAA